MTTYHTLYLKDGKRLYQCDNGDRAPHVFHGEFYCANGCGKRVKSPKRIKVMA